MTKYLFRAYCDIAISSELHLNEYWLAKLNHLEYQSINNNNCLQTIICPKYKITISICPCNMLFTYTIL